MKPVILTVAERREVGADDDCFRLQMVSEHFGKGCMKISKERVVSVGLCQIYCDVGASRRLNKILGAPFFQTLDQGNRLGQVNDGRIGTTGSKTSGKAFPNGNLRA